jgi:hypothetical protein
VVQDVFTRHALATGCWHKTARWPTSGRRS